MEKSEPSSPGFPSETSILLLGPTAADTGLSRTNVTNAAAFSSIAHTQSSLLYLRTVPGVLELDMSEETGVAAKPALSSKDPVLRRAASKISIGRRSLSFPKIISGRIGGAVQP